MEHAESHKQFSNSSELIEILVYFITLCNKLKENFHFIDPAHLSVDTGDHQYCPWSCKI